MTLNRYKKLRLCGACVIGLVLAALLLVQGLSSVLTKRSPETAVRLFRGNGLAQEQVAFLAFSSAAAKTRDESSAANLAASKALETFGSAPLTPKAHVILALSQTDDSAKQKILGSAYELNRRDLAVQGLVLQQRISERDYPGMLEALDQILRVHPQYSQEFFPLLADALAEEETVPLFATILDGSAIWHKQFLGFSVRRKNVLPNLANLRPKISIADVEFDSQLISGLATTGDIARASTLVRELGVISKVGPARGPLDWKSTYPPFEWELVDQAGFRAQASSDGDKLELLVRAGKGGIIAGRMIESPRAPFVVAINHRIAPVDQARDVKLQLLCSGQAEPFLDERFKKGELHFKVESVPESCQYIVIAINARAWSGRSALGGTIDRIEIVEGS